MEKFDKWYDVIYYCVYNKCVPTMIVLEKDASYYSSSQDFALYYSEKDYLRKKAKGQDELIDGLYNDEALMR